MFLNKRGGVPPIVTALVLVAFLISAGLIAWYVIYTTSLATKRALLEVSGGCYIVNNVLYITVKNIGSSRYEGVISITLTDGSNTYTGSVNITLLPGQSMPLKITLSGTPTADTLGGVLQYGESTIKIVADVIKG